MKKIIFTLSLAVIASSLFAGDTLRNKKNSLYSFTFLKDNEATNVRNQCQTGTCWTFSTLSFLESEILRKGKGKHTLSEMFIVRNAYYEKAIMYLRMDGKVNFDEGGEFHDIPMIIKKYGIVPDEIYLGLRYKGVNNEAKAPKDRDTVHNHGELLGVLKAMLEKYKDQNSSGTLSPVWKDAVNGVLDAYFGKLPEKFNYRGKEYTPITFAKSVDLNMDDYVAITSFTHHDYYKPFVIEVPDNWSLQPAYNVTLDELSSEMNSSIQAGYTIAWASDVSEKGFSFRDGLGIVPENDTLVKQKGKDNKHFNNAGATRSSSAFDMPYPEKAITPEVRQIAYDNKQTTDDHGMHITGLLKDQNGTLYYKVKNSWGIDNYLGGYLYVSNSFARYKTICIMVHKDALSKGIKQKLNIK